MSKEHRVVGGEASAWTNWLNLWVILPRIPGTDSSARREREKERPQCVIIMSSGGYDIYGVGASGGERDEREGIVAG